MQTKGQVFYLPSLVEMPGIEPGSEEFEHGYTTSLVALLVARARPERQGLVRACRKVFDLCYRRYRGRTLVFLTPTLQAPERPGGERDITLGRQDLLVDAYAAMGRAARFGLLAFVIVPSFNEVQAPRLAIQDQPSPSKPIIPSLHTDYTTFLTGLQAKMTNLAFPLTPHGV